MSGTPATPLVEAMVQMHELHKAMLAAGFTEAQANHILGVWMAQSVTNGTSEPGAGG